MAVATIIGERSMRLKKSGVCFFALFLVVLLAGFGFIFSSNKLSNYENLIEEYLDLRERNDPAAFDLCYFKPEYEYIRDMLLAENYQILSTEILDSEKINENLYAFFIRYNLEEYDEESYSFVAKINEKLYVIINNRDIPEELKENYNNEKFSRYLENGKEVEVFF